MRVTGLHCFPLKSARGLSLQEARIDPWGVRGDRRWALLGSDGRAVTQRDCPVLATVDVRPMRTGIRLGAPGSAELGVDRPSGRRDKERIRVWGSVTEGVPADSAAHEWLSRLVGRPVTLLYMPDEIERPVDPRYGREGDRTGFADGYPILLTSEASLAVLNARLASAVPMDRFRPNLVVDGEIGFAEDEWAAIRAGSLTFRVVKPCPRCVVTTVDQRSGKRGVQPLRELATFRERDGRILFGQNLIPDGSGSVRVGDTVEVLELRREP